AVPRSPLPTLFPYTTLFRSNTTAIRVLPVSMGTQRTGSPRYTSARSVARGAAAPASQQLGQHLDGSPQLVAGACGVPERDTAVRSEEHTSELQSRFDLVCRL